MGKPSPVETTRNADLIRDYKSGKFSQVQLVSKYQISAPRIYQIINREKIKKSNKDNKQIKN
jgi:Mor family transcriptional regulator